MADPAQSIYYKGVSWKDGSVIIHSSRVKTLQKNFRNSKQILETAWAIASSADKLVLDEVIKPEKTERIGSRPRLLIVKDQSDQDLKCMKDIIIYYSSSNRFRPGDIAVLCRTIEKAKEVTFYLNRASIPVCHFRDNDFNVFENNVKVITINSAKGLEFPIVILMNVDEGVIPRSLNHIQNQEDLEVALKSERQLLYVGMTRAADELCMITSFGRGSRFLNDIPKEMLIIESLA